MTTFQSVLNNNKEYITILARREALKQKNEKIKKLQSISQEIQQAHDEKQNDTISENEQDGDLYQIFKNPYADQRNINATYDENNSVDYDDYQYGRFELREYDTTHNIDKQKYAAFKKANGVTYGTHNRADKQRELKIKQLKRLPNRPDSFRISNVWTPSEQQTFLKIARACSFDAKIIATFLPHKTENLVRRHLVWCRKNDFLTLMGRNNYEHGESDDQLTRIPLKNTATHSLAKEAQPDQLQEELQKKTDEEITKTAIENIRAILAPKSQQNKVQAQDQQLQELIQSGFIVNINSKVTFSVQDEASNDEGSDIVHELDCFI